MIALGEVNGLCAQVLLRDGHTFDPTGLTGVAKFAEHAHGWRQLAGPARELMPALGGWLLAYGLLDCVFTLAYGWGLLRLIRWITAGPGAGPAGMRIARAAALSGIAADLVENLLIVALSRTSPARGAASWIAGVLPWVSTLKWAALAIAAIVIVVRGAPTAVAGTTRVLHALYTHRYSAIIVAPIAALGLAKGGDLIEQVPDIQRRWVQGEQGSLVGAGVVSILLAVAMFAIGRQRTHHLWVRREPAPRRDAPTPPLLPWVLVPAAVVAVAVVNGGAQSRLWWFVALPLAVAAASAARRWAWGLRLSGWRWTAQTDVWRDHRPQRPPVSDAQFRTSALVGDLLPVALVAVMGLGAVRSATAVVAMAPLGLRVDLWKYALFLAAGAVGAVLVWWPYTALLAALAAPGDPTGVLSLRRVARRAVRLLPAAVVVSLTPGLEPSAGGAYRRNWLAWVFFAGAWAGLLVVGLLPMRLADGIGVIAAFQLGLGLGALLIAALVCALQSTGSPEVFWWRPTTLAFTPVTTLALAILLFISAFGNVSDVHPIRAATSTTAGTRPTIVEAVTGWMDSPSCTTSLKVPIGAKTADVTVRPMLLLAAEGGGIRAAYWTAAALDALGDDTGHGCRPFLASGASGGAVGLSIAAVSAPGEARRSVVALSGQEALTAASVGLLIRDLGYAATGIPLRSDSGSPDWIDRAGLIEEVWESKVPGLQQAFVVGRGEQSAATGYLALNSTSATSLCRTLLSQVDLGEVATNGHGLPCGAQGGLPGSIDLLTCTGSRNRSTIALMASRFPYVTPSGVAPDSANCGLGEQQIVDGGYAENTGIGTLADLAPLWLPRIRAHNARVVDRLLAGSALTSGDQLIVPVLVYFDNGTGSDLGAKPRQRELEFLVPPLTRTAQASLADEPSNIARVEALLAADQLWSLPARPGAGAAPQPDPDAVDTALTAAVRSWRPHAVVRVYQPTTPSVAAPLGWVLSTESQSFMDRALACPAQRAGALADGSLATLVTMLGGRC